MKRGGFFRVLGAAIVALFVPTVGDRNIVTSLPPGALPVCLDDELTRISLRAIGPQSFVCGGGISKPRQLTLLGRPLGEDPDLTEDGGIGFGDLGPDWNKWLLERIVLPGSLVRKVGRER